MNEIDELIRGLKENLVLSRVPQNPIGFITRDLQLFPISLDTKLLSKLIEITSISYIIQEILPKLHHWKLYFPTAQNVYPDMIFINKNAKKMVAVDFKSTYLKNETSISGFTLGTFNGYFKNKMGSPCCKAVINGKEKKFYYGEFSEHYLICYIYKRKDDPELLGTKLKNFDDLKKATQNIDKQIEIKHIVVTPKWKVARKVPGSGNTANIGSISNVNDLVNGNAEFDSKEQFEEFWTYRFDHTLALKRIRKTHKSFQPPYKDFNEYLDWVSKGKPNLEFYNKVLKLF
ncbi:MAG: type II restriction endonuclease [Promethearchaeota archaeon]